MFGHDVQQPSPSRGVNRIERRPILTLFIHDYARPRFPRGQMSLSANEDSYSIRVVGGKALASACKINVLIQFSSVHVNFARNPMFMIPRTDQKFFFLKYDSVQQCFASHRKAFL